MKIIKRNFSSFFPVIFFILVVVLLTPGLLNNTWGTVGKKWFSDWRAVKDANFVGRLVQSQHHGIFSYAGLLGWGDESSFKDNWELTSHQYEVFLTSKDFVTEDFKTYNSVIDFQGFVFGLLERLMNFFPKARLFIFQGLTALSTAVALGLIVLWIYREIGLMAAVFTAGFMMLSEWLTLFGGSIYWSLWAFYIPLIAIAYYISSNQAEDEIRSKLFLIVYLSVLIKFLFNGFEYVTTVLIMVFSPLIYYALVNSWKLKTVLKTFSNVIFAEFLATLTALSILAIQNMIVLNGMGNAVNYILYSLEKRSIGIPDAFTSDPSLAASLRADTLIVVKEYILGRAINLNLSFLPPYFPDLKLKNLEISYLSIFIVFVLVTILFYSVAKVIEHKELKTSSFIVTTWLSAVAPLSWLIIFKAHAYLHLHLDFIIWQMPFAFLGFGMCGAILQFFLTRLLSIFHLKKEDIINKSI
jgi:hypothetical protein